MNTTEVREVIDRLDKATHPCLNVTRDTHRLLGYVRSLTDTTPLSELTHEQWEEAGFDVNSYTASRVVNAVDICYGRISKLLMINGKSLPIITLGQLRHLIAALEG